MKRNQILSRLGIFMLCVAILVWAVVTLPVGVVFILVIFLIVAYISYLKTNKDNLDGPNRELNIQGLTEKYGTPDDMITTDPTRGNEVQGCILVYREKGFFVINGLEVKKSEITDCVLKNDGPHPYLPADYHLHLATTLDDYPVLTVSVGNEVSWAEQVLMEVQKELK